MLSAWFRFKYPNVVDGALAASAPIYIPANLTDHYAFFGLVTKVCVCVCVCICASIRSCICVCVYMHAHCLVPDHILHMQYMQSVWLQTWSCACTCLCVTEHVYAHMHVHIWQL